MDQVHQDNKDILSYSNFLASAFDSEYKLIDEILCSFPKPSTSSYDELKVICSSTSLKRSLEAKHELVLKKRRYIDNQSYINSLNESAGIVPISKCLYKTGKCQNPRATKRNGAGHSLCEFHRKKANESQRKLDRKKRIIRLNDARKCSEDNDSIVASLNNHRSSHEPKKYLPSLESLQLNQSSFFA